MAGAAGEVSYPTGGNAICFAIEDTSFWFGHRNHCILSALRRLPPPGTIFDIGGGNGYVARAMQDAGLDVVMVEPGAEGIQNALGRGVRNVVRGTLDDLHPAPGSLAAVSLFDVLEHIPDDIGFLRQIHSLMKPGGRIYITVPAYQWLWSHEDSNAGHARRYTLGRLIRALSTTGYSAEFGTYFFGFLPLPILLRRVLPYRLGMRSPAATESSARVDHQPTNPLVRSLIELFARRELAALDAGKSLRCGGSCLGVATKR